MHAPLLVGIDLSSKFEVLSVKGMTGGQKTENGSRKTDHSLFRRNLSSQGQDDNSLTKYKI